MINEGNKQKKGKTISGSAFHAYPLHAYFGNSIHPTCFWQNGKTSGTTGVIVVINVLFRSPFTPFHFPEP
jgi:hypothetical protein